MSDVSKRQFGKVLLNQAVFLFTALLGNGSVPVSDGIQHLLSENISPNEATPRYSETEARTSKMKPKRPFAGGGMAICGAKTHNGSEREVDTNSIHDKSSPLQVKFKPRPAYTKKARDRNIQGQVRLRATFMANGRIGQVVPIKRLTDGLTEKAVEAAMNIKFIPEKRCGKTIGVRKTVVFNFTIH